MKGEVMHTELNYKCPKCHQKMEEGYVVAVPNIAWAKHDEKSCSISAYHEKLIKISLKKQPHIPGIRCRKCQLAILKFEDIKK
jgi:DNA-directed RNA polymerase subunit RPC12/RpoP